MVTFHGYEKPRKVPTAPFILLLRRVQGGLQGLHYVIREWIKKRLEDLADY